MPVCRAPAAGDFYPRPPRGGRPFCSLMAASCAYFYPRPPRGGRPYPLSLTDQQQRFLSTPSARRATWTNLHYNDEYSKFLSTPSARRATNVQIIGSAIVIISIHALREEGDRDRPTGVCRYRISIHALREEGDIRSHFLHPPIFDFYPRPPRGGRLVPYDRCVARH